MASSSAHHLQAKFFTKQPKYAVPNTPFSIPASVTIEELNSLIRSLLKENAEVGAVDFDFLVANEFLRTTLAQHVEAHSITSETLIDIEYVEKLPAPTPEDFFPHDDWVSAVHVSEEWILTGCYDHSLRIWSIDGEHKLTIPGHVGPVKAVAWLKTENRDSRTFISSSHDQTVMMWEWNSITNSVDCIYVCRGHARSVDAVAASAGGDKFISGSFDKMVKLWSTEAEGDVRDEDHCKRLKTEHGVASKNRTPIMTISGHKEAVSGVQWMSENEACSSSWDHTIRLWDLEIGGLKTQLVGTKSFLGISYSKLNHHIISASSDRHVRLWDSRIGDGSVVQNVFTSHNGWVTCVDWCKELEYHFITGSHDAVLKLWDTRSPKLPLYDMSGHEDRILCCSWANKELLLSGGADNHLRIFKHKIEN